MYVGVCVSEGHTWGEQSPIHANFSLDYMNWLSVLVEARHAGPSAANPPLHFPIQMHLSPRLLYSCAGLEQCSAPSSTGFPSSPRARQST